MGIQMKTRRRHRGLAVVRDDAERLLSTAFVSEADRVRQKTGKAANGGHGDALPMRCV